MKSIEEIKADIEEYKHKFVSACHSEFGISPTSFQNAIDVLEEELKQAIINSISLKRLEQLCNAEREETLLILPCKTGDIVFRIYNTRGCENCSERGMRCDGISCPAPKYYEKKFEYSDLKILEDIKFTKEAAEKALMEMEAGK